MRNAGPLGVAVLAFLGGYLLWETSPAVFGRVEPWDASVHLYLVLLFVIGWTASLPAPRWYWLAAPAVAGGQVVFMHLHLPPGPFGPLGLLIAAAVSIVSGVGGWCLYQVVRRRREALSKRTSI